ncbi:MAG: M28 family peptidase [Flavobacteriales bacterium]|nr:M28 family peptidase [Flavobacteriales bacterium]
MHRIISTGLVAFAALLLAPFATQAQSLMPDSQAVRQMRLDVYTLADDSMQGRETGTMGEQMAARYLVDRFRSIGLSPKGDSSSYLNAFQFAAMPRTGPDNMLKLGRHTLKLGEDFYPLGYSANAQVLTRVARAKYGIKAPEKDRNDFEHVDVKDHAVCMSISSPDGIHPHSAWLAHNDLRSRIDDAVSLGANAIIFYNDDPDKADDPSSDFYMKLQPTSVPVVFLTKSGFAKLGQDGDPVVIHTEIIREEKTGHNVVGYLGNGKPYTVVIGAHYDHLGYGGEGSLYRGEPAIHNGADDNASGVAVLMQLAEDLQQMPNAKNNNYLFIAFSGEEKGLYGSNAWSKHPTLPIDSLNYMINMDMVGRLDSLGHLAINGVGTSPAWAAITDLKTGGLTIKTTEGGIGPSDHTSFYLQNVPAIHFFTGSHEDYHKPGDDADKVDYPGMLRIARYIEEAITTMNDSTKITFTKTADSDTSKAPRFSVTLGVVPDYMYDGKGLKIDGVTENKPAALAGLKQGDVVIKLGDHEVPDMMGYMKALGMFKKGDTTQVTVLREGKEMKTDIHFK